MKLDKKDFNILRIALLAILFYFVLLRIDAIAAAAGSMLGLAAPFIAGGIIAFIINVPMTKLEKALDKTGLKKIKRATAFLLTVVIITAAASGFLLIVVPQLAQTLTVLTDHLQVFFSEVPGMIAGLGTEFSFVEEYINSLNINWGNIGQQIIGWLQNFAISLLNSGSGMVSGVISGFTTAVFSVIFAIYLLFGKEKNTAALKRLVSAVTKEKTAERIFYICSLTYRSFANFLSGQCLEAVILGCMFALTMTIFRLPYALLTGMVIAVTALIPVFGAFIGCGVGVLLLAIESPGQVLLFVVLFLILQQIEGNVIYPRVVGNKVGLPSILVFMSVILGSSLMGVAGMLIFIPGASVLYTLTKEFVETKEAAKAATETDSENP